MSGKILKTDIISEDVVKGIADIVVELNKLLKSVKDLKKASGGGAGLKELGEASKEAKRYLAEMADVAKRIAKFEKQQLGEMADIAKRIAKNEKNKVTDKKKNVNEWIAAAKRVATFEKKDISDRIAAYKRVVSEEKKKDAAFKLSIAERIAAYKKVVVAEKRNIAERIVGAKKVAAAEKATQAAFKKDMAERVAAYKRVAANEKKLSADRVRQDKTQLAAQNKKSSGFKNLIKSALAYGAAMIGITQIIRFFTTTLFNLTKKLDSLNFSMKTVIKDTKEFAATTLFLTKTSINYGLDLLTLTERYIKFRAAAMQSNLAASETMKIFDSTAKAAAVLGLKTDEVNGVFLALEQMISKGKVTTEELRRQLGERLPGAFGIMASAIGVSIVELDKMLKAGEVLSSDALPKFAVALEKAYGIESVEKVNTLASAQGRLKTTWVEFVEAIKASNTYISILNEFSGAINDIRLAFNMMTEFEKLSREQGVLGDAVRETVEQLKDLDVGASRFKDMSIYQQIWIDGLEKTGISQKKAIRLFNEYVKVRQDAITLDKEPASRNFGAFDSEQFGKDLDKVEKDAKSFSNQTSAYLKDNILESNKFLSKNVTTYKQVLLLQKEDLKIQRERAESWVQQSEDMMTRGELNEEQAKQYKFASEELIGLTEAEIEVANRLVNIEKKGKDGKPKEFDIRGAIELQRQLQDAYDAHYTKRLSLARNNAEETINIEREMVLDSLANDVLTLTQKEELYARLRKLDDEYFQWKSDAAISEFISTANDERAAIATKYTKDLVDSKNRASKRKATEVKLATELLGVEYRLQQDIIDSDKTLLSEKEAAAEKQKQLEEELQKTIRKGAVETERLKREELQNTLNFIGDSANAAFDIQQQFSDNQSQRAQDRYDRDMQLAGDSVAAQLVAKRKLEKEERKIAKRQAIAAKAQAAFNIGLSTAQSIIGIWAQVPKFDFGISAGVLTAAVAAIGAAQLAAALSAPLPQFAEGGITSTDSIVAGEKGVELGITPSGETFLTPSKASVLSGVPLGTEIIPHDETSRILAQQAINSTYNSVDMSRTNSYLRDIRDKKTDSVVYQNGYKIVTRKGYEGKFKV